MDEEAPWPTVEISIGEDTSGLRMGNEKEKERSENELGGKIRENDKELREKGARSWRKQ